jgi:Leucine-rich repeat (LRR) protein
MGVPADGGEGRLLDGFFLLAAAGQQQPELVITANVSGLELIDIAGEDLQYFANLQTIDLSDNELSYSTVLEQLSGLPRVSSVSLSCNLISSLVLSAAAPHPFPHLERLDLSFNELHGDVLIQLSSLKRLKSLDLSNNCVSSIPPDLDGLHQLQDLNLAANDLVQFDQWRALDSLPSLTTLSLAL